MTKNCDQELRRKRQNELASPERCIYDRAISAVGHIVNFWPARSLQLWIDGLTFPYEIATRTFGKIKAPRLSDGQMLIAMPAMGDERFPRSLIYSCATLPPKARLGIVVNHQAPNINLPICW